MTGFPTLILFDDGRPVGQHVGMADMPALLRYAGVRAQPAAAQVAGPAAAAESVGMELILSSRAQAGLLDELVALRRELGSSASAEALRHVDAISAIVSASAKLL